jgi:hypothetical protein
MKTKSAKKTAAVLAMCMSVSLFAGCGSQDQTTASASSSGAAATQGSGNAGICILGSGIFSGNRGFLRERSLHTQYHDAGSGR